VAVENEWAGGSEKLDEFEDRVPFFRELWCRLAPFMRPAGVAPLIGELMFDFDSLFAAACDFFKWAAGLDKWLAPVGLPRRTEHFWKCLFKISLRENVSRQRTHMYGRSPVSI
jgi:hypothetical protein